MYYKDHVKPFEPSYIDLLAENMCKGDRDEVFATSNGNGIPWLLSTEYLYSWKRKNLRSFLKSTKSWIEHMGEMYPFLHNYVDTRNTESINWLKHLGFKFTKTIEDYGYLKIPFIKFEKYKEYL